MYLTLIMHTDFNKYKSGSIFDEKIIDLDIVQDDCAEETIKFMKKEIEEMKE